MAFLCTEPSSQTNITHTRPPPGEKRFGLKSPLPPTLTAKRKNRISPSGQRPTWNGDDSCRCCAADMTVAGRAAKIILQLRITLRVGRNILEGPGAWGPSLPAIVGPLYPQGPQDTNSQSLARWSCLTSAGLEKHPSTTIFSPHKNALTSWTKNTAICKTRCLKTCEYWRACVCMGVNS